MTDTRTVIYKHAEYGWVIEDRGAGTQLPLPLTPEATPEDVWGHVVQFGIHVDEIVYR